MPNISSRIRAIHAADKTISRAEIARRVGSSRTLVSRVLGPAEPRSRPLAVIPMGGSELAACLRKAGVSRAWVACWLGMTSSQINTRIQGTVNVQPAEAVLFRLLASGEVELDRIVRLSLMSA